MSDYQCEADVFEELFTRESIWASYVTVCINGGNDDLILFDSRRDMGDSPVRDSHLFQHLARICSASERVYIYFFARVLDHEYVWRLHGSATGWKADDPHWLGYNSARKLYWHEIPVEP